MVGCGLTSGIVVPFEPVEPPPDAVTLICAMPFVIFDMTLAQKPDSGFTSTCTFTSAGPVNSAFALAPERSRSLRGGGPPEPTCSFAMSARSRITSAQSRPSGAVLRMSGVVAMLTAPPSQAGNSRAAGPQYDHRPLGGTEVDGKTPGNCPPAASFAAAASSAAAEPSSAAAEALSAGPAVPRPHKA